MRLKNLAGLVIGQHLLFDGHDYRVSLTAAETKTGRPYVAAVPHELTPYIDRWLQVYRRVPLRAAGPPVTANIEKHLWINRSGKPMRSRAIHEQIKKRTREAFGKGSGRTCSATVP